MSNKDKAVNNFDSGYNCAQSVLTPFTNQMNLDTSTVLKMAQGFGAGMGRLQETCGAITGAYMVLGLKYSKQIPDDEINNKIAGMIREFTHRFKVEHGMTSCKELLNCDLKTEKGQQFFADNKLHEKVCSKCVGNAVEILEDLINND